MDKRQLINEIRAINATASEAFLEQFNEADLGQYLDRLKDAASHSMRIVGWSAREPRLRKVS